jgi:hypothetical protein
LTTSYHVVLEWGTLWMVALPSHVIVLIDDVIVLVWVRLLHDMFFGLRRLQKQMGILVQPPKFLLVQSSSMDRIAQVVHPHSLPVVPLHNICIMLSTPVDRSPILPHRTVGGRYGSPGTTDQQVSTMRQSPWSTVCCWPVWPVEEDWHTVWTERTIHSMRGGCPCGSSMPRAPTCRGNKSNLEFKYGNKNYCYTKKHWTT